MRIYILNGQVLSGDEKRLKTADLCIKNGVIESIGGEMRPEPEDTVIDAGGCVVSPGLIDIHVHLREPGFEYKETIASGLAAAAAGGFTLVCPMANTSPAIDSPELISLVLAKGWEAGGSRLAPIGALTLGLRGRELSDFRALKAAGAVALSDDGVPLTDTGLLRQALRLAGELGMTIISHCEDDFLAGNRAVNEGRVSKELGLEGRPAIAEDLMVMRDAMLCLESGAGLHIAHVSTKGAVDIIRRFKALGAPLTAETCPQYFTLTEDEVLKKGALARVNPPLRTAADVEAVIEGLKDGTIDVICTDHAPHSAEEKAAGLEEAPSGMVGLETALGLALTVLYHGGQLTMAQLLAKLTANAADALGLSFRGIVRGAKADITVFDPEEKWTVRPEEFKSKGRNTPFEGFELKGRVKATIADGKVVYIRE